MCINKRLHLHVEDSDKCFVFGFFGGGFNFENFEKYALKYFYSTSHVNIVSCCIFLRCWVMHDFS